MHCYQPPGRSFLAAFVALYLAACAHSPPPPPAPPQPLYRDVTRQATATVEVAEPVTRLIKLHTTQGSTWLRAGPEVRNFNQIKVGDTVTVTYYMAIAAQLTPKGAAPIPQQMAVSAARALPGERPAGGMGTTVVETVTIQSVDKEANTVTFLRQDGTVDTASVHSSEGRTFIAGLHSGDQVDVALSEAVAISVDAAH
jgi:hypothetical protein